MLYALDSAAEMKQEGKQPPRRDSNSQIPHQRLRNCVLILSRIFVMTSVVIAESARA